MLGMYRGPPVPQVPLSHPQSPCGNIKWERMTSQEVPCLYDYANEGLDSELDPGWLKMTRGSLA